MSQPAILVPLKPLSEAKSRLREAFDDAARGALVRAMLADVLAAAREAYAGPIYLVSSDAGYDDLAGAAGAVRLPDVAHDYNSAVAGALKHPLVRGAGAALVLPADHPRAQAADIATALEALDEAEVVIVAARDGGTGVLGLRPLDAIAPAFGPDSAQRHMMAAAGARRRVVVLNCPSLALDVDVPADLAFRPADLGPATRAFLEAHPIEAATHDAGGARGAR